MLLAVLLMAAGSTCNAAESQRPEDGVALAIVFDTSGSMKDPVQDKSGGQTAKYIVANRALQAVVNRLEAFVRGGKRLDIVFYTFQGNGVREQMPIARFDPKPLREWAKKFNSPAGNTPLGRAVRLAAEEVLRSPLTRKHVLLVTDGMNTVGPEPKAVIPSLRELAEKKQTSLGLHLVAFDIDAALFDPIKKLGATVVGAADEAQLNTRLDFILREKILLEDEEPRTDGKKN
jgi:hypothetical protein